MTLRFCSRLLACALAFRLLAVDVRAYDNLADYEADLVKYHDSAYIPDIRAVTDQAAAYVVKRAAQGGGKLAMVLDIDETSLSDWKEITGLMDFGYNEGVFNAWAQEEQSEPIVPTVDLFRKARAAGVSVFFVSGRPEKLRHATEENLRKAGYDGWTGLDMKSPGYKAPAGVPSKTAAFKTMCRCAIEAKGYVIIANVGDQESDLAGGHAERTFKIPNPFYRIP